MNEAFERKMSDQGARLIPEYIGQTTYAAIHRASVATVLEGHCPTCSAELRAGVCATCRHTWRAWAGDARTVLEVIEDGRSLRWIEGPA